MMSGVLATRDITKGELNNLNKTHRTFARYVDQLAREAARSGDNGKVAASVAPNIPKFMELLEKFAEDCAFRINL